MVESVKGERGSSKWLDPPDWPLIREIGELITEVLSVDRSDIDNEKGVVIVEVTPPTMSSKPIKT